MNVYLSENGDQLPGDMIVRWVLRSDLTPVPRTVEMSVRVKDGIDAKLKEGAFFWTGRELLKYRIVKAQRGDSAGVIQGADSMGVLNITALLSSCAAIAFRRSRAVIRENANIGELYRACGAEVAIANDFAVRRFACLAGEVPSFALARAMQEEAAALVLRENKLSLVRIADFFKQQPLADIVVSDDSGKIESEFIQRHEIPAFFSIGLDGGFVMGANESARQIQYLPRTSERALRNMSKCLVTRRAFNAGPSQEIRAGDVIASGGVPYVVITSASVFESVDQGTVDSYSKLWVGTINN